MNIEVLNKVDISALKERAMQGRFIKVLPASVWREYDWTAVRQLMHETGTYVLPTQELIDYLARETEGMRTIEIGAGNGVVGRTLGIPITDSCLQRDNKAVRQHYAICGQPIINYPKDIIKAEAMEAVRRFKPEAVVGCYVTHKWRNDTQSGNDWGIDFERLLSSVKKFILVGNRVTHRDNPIMALPHIEERFEGLITRAGIDEPTNCVFIWERESVNAEW